MKRSVRSSQVLNRVPRQITVKILPGNGNSKRITIPKEYHYLFGDTEYVSVEPDGGELRIKPQQMIEQAIVAP